MTKTDIAGVLAESTFFGGLERDDIAFLAEHARERELDQGALLFEHGQPADRFYLLRRGEVVVEVPAIQGPTLTVQTLGPDEVLGWSWLIPPYRWSFQARAMEAVTVLEFDGGAVRERCEREPAFGYEVLKRFSSLMSERLDAARRKMMDEWNPAGFA